MIRLSTWDLLKRKPIWRDIFVTWSCGIIDVFAFHHFSAQPSGFPHALFELFQGDTL